MAINGLLVIVLYADCTECLLASSDTQRGYMTQNDPTTATDSHTTIITLSVHADDAQRILIAFRDGKLADLGVLDVKLAKKQWASEEEAKRQESNTGKSPAERP